MNFAAIGGVAGAQISHRWEGAGTAVDFPGGKNVRGAEERQAPLPQPRPGWGPQPGGPVDGISGRRDWAVRFPRSKSTTDRSGVRGKAFRFQLVEIVY